MCQVYFECYLWIQWEQSFQKISSASQASERNFFFFFKNPPPPYRGTHLFLILHTCALQTSVTNALC